MSAAATVAVTITCASMSIALVLISMHFAAILTSVRGQLIQWNIILALVRVIVLIRAIID